MQIETTISLVGAMCAILSVAMLYFKTISGIQQRLTRMETKMEPFWRIIEKELPRILSNPGNTRKDHLLEKLSNKTLTEKEATELKHILENEIHHTNSNKVVACILVMARLEHIIGGVA